MLHVEALPPGTLPVLERLMAMPILRDHALVGGTALALRYGHRLSVDLDLFGGTFDHDAIRDALKEEFGTSFHYEPGRGTAIGLFCFVGAVKVDIVKYPHARIAELERHGPVRMYADPDIAAMKIQALLGRGKKKDFWDLYTLLQHHDLSTIMGWHRAKYPDQMLAISIPSAVAYFTDAEDSEDPVSLQGQTWEGVKASIQKVVRDYLS
mgnify:CR=1 FL=1